MDVLYKGLRLIMENPWTYDSIDHAMTIEPNMYYPIVDGLGKTRCCKLKFKKIKLCILSNVKLVSNSDILF